MKYFKSIYELFNTDTISDSEVFKTKFLDGSRYHGAFIDISIDNVPYRFTTHYKELKGKTFIYISFHIINQEEYIDIYSKKDFSDYEFIINKNMTTKVLNTLPLLIETYKQMLLEKGLNPIINGFYYDVNEAKRENIYKYYFTNRLGNRLKDIYKDTFYFIELEEPTELKNFSL